MKEIAVKSQQCSDIYTVDFLQCALCIISVSICLCAKWGKLKKVEICDKAGLVKLRGWQFGEGDENWESPVEWWLLVSIGQSPWCACEEPSFWSETRELRCKFFWFSILVWWIDLWMGAHFAFFTSLQVDPSEVSWGNDNDNHGWYMMKMKTICHTL